MRLALVRSAALLAACICSAGAWAQTSSPAAPLPIGAPVDLASASWRAHCGDNPAWADPAFDDNAWPTVNPHAPLPSAATPTPASICWYRTTVHVDPALKNLDISIERAVLTDFDLFANGKRIGGIGQMPPSGKRAISVIHTFPLSVSAASTGKLTIAVRLWRYGRYDLINALPGLPFVARLGQLPELTATYQNQILNQVAYGLAGGPVIGFLVSCLALGLFVGQRDRNEYLWLGIYGISFMAVEVVSIISYAYVLSALWAEGTVLIFQNLILVAFIEFFLAFLGRRPVWWIRAYECLFITPLLIGELGALGKMDVVFSYQLSNILFLPGTVMLGVFLFIEYRRRNREAAILIVPTLLAVGTYDLSTVLNLLGTMHVNVAWLLSLLTFHVGFLQYNIYAACLTLFWISMCVIILRRSLRDTHEKARLASEFDAARSVQQLLISSDQAASQRAADPSMAVSAFSIESIYLPASEVGGDFYQVTPVDDGSLLVVVGDVSGKGLRAAMTVSTIVGALRGSQLRDTGLHELPLHEPGKILAHLNRVLAGQISGFVTCCAAHIAADGTLTLANAGHIPPYCNGEELPAESGLPLGIVVGARYEQVQCRLEPDDRLTFVSDGVIEATNRRKELFGFERTRQISNRPAWQIAEVARDFGQEDDITVLTVAWKSAPAFPVPAP